MLLWRDLGAVPSHHSSRAGPPPKCRARAGGRRLSIMTAILSSPNVVAPVSDPRHPGALSLGNARLFDAEDWAASSDHPYAASDLSGVSCRVKPEV